MAAEMVSSAVAQEAVNQVLSKFKERNEGKSDAKENIERMEMAHIKLEAALETSNRWNITSVPLQRWRSKLKRAAQECDETLRRCRQRLQEEEEAQQGVRSSSFPKRIAQTTKSFISDFFSRGNDDDLMKGTTTVRRFERFTDGASEFLRYMELGSTPRQYMFFEPLVQHLLAGKRTKYCFVREGQHLSFVLKPCSLHEHGMEGNLIFLLEDANAPQNNYLLSLNLRISESTDIVAVAIRCLQLFIPHLSSTVEIVRAKLAHLPTKDFCWVSNGYSVCGQNERLDNIRTLSRKWYRPNMLCCPKQDHHYSPNYAASSPNSSSSPESFQCDIYLEPVNQVYLLGHVALSSGNNRQRAAVDSKTIPLRDFQYMKLGGHFWPHASSEDLSPAVGGSATEMINGDAAHHGSLYANISFDQLSKIMLPKAIDCLCRNVAGTLYQMLWKSKHGGAYLQVEKTSWGVTIRKGRGGKHPKRPRGKKVQGWAGANYGFMSSWIAYASAQLQASVVDWVQKEKRLPLSSLFNTNSCAHDCPIKLWSLQDHRSFAGQIKSSCTLNA